MSLANRDMGERPGHAWTGPGFHLAGSAVMRCVLTGIPMCSNGLLAVRHRRPGPVSARCPAGILALMSGLPSGTVTFVFSDIEGSTALLKVLGDRYGEVLSTHRRMMRECFTATGGVEIDTQGDAFFF